VIKVVDQQAQWLVAFDERLKKIEEKSTKDLSANLKEFN
jgi:hypothetical protein